MTGRPADALRRGMAVNRDLVYRINYFELAPPLLEQVRLILGIPSKAPNAVAAGSAGVFDRAGYTEWQLD